MPQELDRDYLTVKQAAEYLQYNQDTIRRYVRQGILESSRIVAGGKIRISAASIEKLLQKARH